MWLRTMILLQISMLDDMLDLRIHGRMARGCHGLPKVSIGLTMQALQRPCSLAAVSEVARPQGGHLRPSSTPLDTPRHTPVLESTSPF
jgi:hypothetical protein